MKKSEKRRARRKHGKSHADWTKPPVCSKGDIDRAGEDLLSDDPDRRAAAAELVDTWRSSYRFPLNAFQVTLRRRARRVDETPIVAQRLKRMVSIRSKLARFHGMKLSRVQDIGGCRAVLSTVAAVRELVSAYTADGYDVRNNYIEEPKPDGYRGVHVIGTYDADPTWAGYKIEIQIRTRLQHAFATTVETVTTFTGEPLKFGGGGGDWRRFFALMGTVIALREKCPPVPGTPANEVELLRELGEHAYHLNVVKRLRGWSAALQRIPPTRVSRAEAYLLVLDPRADPPTISVRSFRRVDEASGQALLFERELMRAGEAAPTSVKDVVQVSAKSLDELRRAYPNYFSDTQAFIRALERALVRGTSEVSS